MGKGWFFLQEEERWGEEELLLVFNKSYFITRDSEFEF